MTGTLRASTFLFGANGTFIEELYNRYVEDPQSIDPEWKEFFAEMGDETASIIKGTEGASWAPRTGKSIVGYVDQEAVAAAKKKTAHNAVDVSSACNDSLMTLMLIRSYRMRGHLLANTDPLGLTERVIDADLQPSNYGFDDDDLDREIYLGGSLGLESATLRDVLAKLRKIYCADIGAEFMHIESLEEREWIEEKLETYKGNKSLSVDEKKHVLDKLLEAQSFEEFLHVKYPGAKRFSIEGGEATVPAMEAFISTSSDLNVTDFVIGMPHRGRLNVLTAVMGKPYTAMLSEFQGSLAHPEEMNISGDVKYHLGTSADKILQNGKSVHVSLCANPSHLEAVNPVVVGRVRAKQDRIGDTERNRVAGILLHGDAAFAGQGVVAETLSLGDLTDYQTGGTLHIIVNNQIGFTTNPKNARISPYPTEVAKIVQAPILHVNGDNPEAVVFVAKLSAEFRHKFKKDVIIDLICYRRHGHNEGDEPMFTQPLMYNRIKNKRRPLQIYSENLMAENIIDQVYFDNIKKKFADRLENAYQASNDYKPNKADWLEGHWANMSKPKSGTKSDAATGLSKKDLEKIGKSLSTAPEHIKLNKKIIRQLQAKAEMFKTGKGFDWSTGEALAFGGLLNDGFPVRLSGQDCRRGTFSHRHAALIDQNNEENYVPLNNIADNQEAKLEVINSNLSEFAVLGFEYGYTLSDPRALTLWEAQFGDFANGAQVIFDQFISSGEEKWLRMSGLVLLLPHGYEGQGPEHSSARLERYLQSCADDNIQVANCTTPAQYFHVLRRQMKRNFRKPLIIMTPKSLLRHKLATSNIEDFNEKSKFQRVIGETEKLATKDKVKRVVLCSGKVYYDLYEERKTRGLKDVVIARLEQFYPFPSKEITELAKNYPNSDFVWCQEEPRNMGGWSFVEPFIEESLIAAKAKAKRPKYTGRKSAASPATGYMSVHKNEQAALVNDALTVK